MLILSRRVGETITIGTNITVTLLGINGGQARIGVHAPKEIEVHREEVAERIKAEKLQIERRNAARKPVEQPR